MAYRNGVRHTCYLTHVRASTGIGRSINQPTNQLINQAPLTQSINHLFHDLPQRDSMPMPCPFCVTGTVHRLQGTYTTMAALQVMRNSCRSSPNSQQLANCLHSLVGNSKHCRMLVCKLCACSEAADKLASVLS